jgi:hypothetical protein
MSAYAWWSEDDQIDYSLTVDDATGEGTLSMNGQGHLPVAAENVLTLVANLPVDPS